MERYLLNERIEREIRSEAQISSLGTLAGVALGVLTRLCCGEQAYRVPGGAAGMGLLITTIPGVRGARLSDYVVNIANCEIGYYAGVFATDYVLNLMK